MESTKMSYEEKRRKAIEMALKDVRDTGEMLGMTASTAFHDELERIFFLNKAKKEFENGIETTLNMSPDQKLLYMFKKTMEISDGDIDGLMEALK